MSALQRIVKPHYRKGPKKPMVIENQLYIKGMTLVKYSEQELKDWVSKYGSVRYFRYFRYFDDSKSSTDESTKPHIYVTYATPVEMKKALIGLTESDATVEVSVSKKNTKKSFDFDMSLITRHPFLLTNDVKLFGPLLLNELMTVLLINGNILIKPLINMI